MVGFNLFAPPGGSGGTVTIWLENIRSVHAFCEVSTQWRTGMGGATGLDYPAVFAALERLYRDLTAEERDEIFSDLQVMEAAALKAMREK